jgi:hypothetical protein
VVSSRVVPYKSLQAENGVDWTVRQGSDVISGTETKVRLGVAQCTEVLADVPTYFYSLNGRASSGLSGLVVSIKRELPVPLGFHLSATGGLGFPTGGSCVVGIVPNVLQKQVARRPQVPLRRQCRLECRIDYVLARKPGDSEGPVGQTVVTESPRPGELNVKTQADPRWWRLLAGDKTSATRFSCRLRSEQ